MTDYCDPRTVTGPKRHISNVQVIYDGGPDDCAVARLDWDGEPGVGIRWNGNAKDQPLGTPQSRGYPFWFRIPVEFTRVVLDEAQKLAETALDTAYREMASDDGREQEATEWSQALIGDVADAAR